MNCFIFYLMHILSLYMQLKFLWLISLSAINRSGVGPREYNGRGYHSYQLHGHVRLCFNYTRAVSLLRFTFCKYNLYNRSFKYNFITNNNGINILSFSCYIEIDILKLSIRLRSTTYAIQSNLCKVNLTISIICFIS